MKKVIRMIVYEGEDSWVDNVLLKSLHVGKNILSPNGSITIFDALSDDPDLIAEPNIMRLKDILFNKIDAQ